MHKACRNRRRLWVKNPKRLMRIVLACLCVSLTAVGALYLQEQRKTSSISLPPASPPLQAAGPATITPQDTSTPSQEPSPSVRIPVLGDVHGYPVIAKLMIESLSLELPVIGEVSEAALKISPCLYAGPSAPEYPGNIVITGHNNRDGSHFGRLDEMKAGDIVTLMNKYGGTYDYAVYEIKTIGAENIMALEEYEGEYALSLVTCADRGKNRLLVMCRPIV